jgi:hypothetical protein
VRQLKSVIAALCGVIWCTDAENAKMLLSDVVQRNFKRL